MRWLLADVTKSDQVKAVMASVIDQVGRLDVLVNNAAAFEIGPLDGSSEQMIRTQFEINVLGLITIDQAALPALIAHKNSIINIGSAAGHKPAPGASIYGATKAAVESLTRSWARGRALDRPARGPSVTWMTAEILAIDGGMSLT